MRSRFDMNSSQCWVTEGLKDALAELGEARLLGVLGHPHVHPVPAQ